jgi:hypothetical protein
VRINASTSGRDGTPYIDPGVSAIHPSNNAILASTQRTTPHLITEPDDPTLPYFMVSTATEAGKKIAETMISNAKLNTVSDHLWRKLSELASTCVNDTCATMARSGISEKLVSIYRAAFGDGYRARLDKEYGAPNSLAGSSSVYTKLDIN